MTANTAFLMAGQGSQEVGMGVPETSVCNGCKRTLQAVDDALGYALSKCMAHGPADELQQTQHAQPAILAMSVMHAQHLMGFGLLPTAVAGHSLGQYAALVVAGALDLGDAARLVSRRGTLMQQAVANRRGSMVAVSGISRDEGKTLCHQASSNGAVVVACFNAPGRLVFSGDEPAVEAVADACEELGFGVMPLPVSAPFHSPLLAPMVAEFSQLVRAAPVKMPTIPVLDNVSGMPVTTESAIRESLINQIEAPVMFEENLQWLHAHEVLRVVQCGPGKALLSFATRTMPGVIARTFTEHLTTSSGGIHAGPL